MMEIDRGNENLQSYIFVCATHMIATSDRSHKMLQAFSNNSMPSAHQPAGSWSKKQEDCLKYLIRSNTVDYKNQTPEYLFDITEQYFPEFISPGTQGRNSAIQHMQGKFVKYEQNIHLRGAWGAQGKYILYIQTLLHAHSFAS